MYFDFVHGLSVDTREKTNRESARTANHRFALRFGSSTLA
jgi:hypothetical protein